MITLEEKIINWKKSLRTNPAMEDGYIEELESHLRDYIEEEINNGVNEEDAFDSAVKRMGIISEIGEEYFKSSTTNKISGRPSWKSPKWMPDLIWNYFKISARSITKNKGISFTNIFGLSVGLASVLLISMIVMYELSFDQFNENKDRIYRVYTEANRPEGKFIMACTLLPFAPEAENEIPEIKHAVRFSESFQLVANGDKKFYENLVYADESIFDVFSFPLKYGDSRSALSEINSIVISEKTAEKYFGENNPVGKTLLLQNKEYYTVKGVFYDLPGNSSIKVEIFASIKTLYNSKLARLTSWTSFSNDYTFVLLKKDARPADVENKFKAIVKKNIDPEIADRYTMKLQSLRDIHLSNLNYDFARTTPPLYLYIFIAVAGFILIIACVNFINLTTARSSKRGKEVGIRKVAGASRMQLVKQFLSEAFIITFISFLVSMGIAYLLIPEMNTLLNSNISFSLMLDRDFVFIVLTLLAFTSIAAGLYPAFVLSNTKPVSAMKGTNSRNSKGYYLRAVLIVFQFALSVFLMISTITIYNQADYLTNHNPGFNSSQILVIPIYDPELAEKNESLKNSLMNDNRVLNVSFSSGTPASGSSNTSNFIAEGRSDEDDIHMQVLEVDYDFINTYGLIISEGREFSKEFSADADDSYLINETAVKKFGFDSPLGKKIKLGDGRMKTIVGVVKDFNYSSLRSEIAPAVFKLNTGGSRFLSVKINTADSENTLEFVKKTVAEFSPNYPVEYYFMDEKFENFYKAERTIGKLLSAFSSLAIIISCIGILGLVSFVAEQKAKEIGIRKVLGASVKSILMLIGKQFIKWIVVSNILIWPVAYLFLDNWLNSFAYRINIGYWVFGSTLLFTVLITLIMVSFHAGKAALANPVKSLKYE